MKQCLAVQFASFLQHGISFQLFGLVIARESRVQQQVYATYLDGELRRFLHLLRQILNISCSSASVLDMQHTFHFHTVLLVVLHVGAPILSPHISITVSHRLETPANRVVIIHLHSLVHKVVGIDALVILYRRAIRTESRNDDGRLACLVCPMAEAYQFIAGLRDGRTCVAVGFAQIHVIISDFGHQPPVVCLVGEVKRLPAGLCADGELVLQGTISVRPLEVASVCSVSFFDFGDCHSGR